MLLILGIVILTLICVFAYLYCDELLKETEVIKKPKKKQKVYKVIKKNIFRHVNVWDIFYWVEDGKYIKLDTTAIRWHKLLLFKDDVEEVK